VLLEAKNLSAQYGSVNALASASFAVDEGEIVALIGPNGAGKSTAVKAACGILPHYSGSITSGAVVFGGQDVTGLQAHEIVRQGLAIVPEGRRLFPSMSVRENLEMGAHTIREHAIREDLREMVLSLFPRLRERLAQTAGTLSGGEQQMLALGRGLMTDPRLLVADEPSLGLSPSFVDVIFDKFVEINKRGVSILIVEQNAQMALETADRAYIFEVGRIRAEGKASKLLAQPDVQDAYLGA